MSAASIGGFLAMGGYAVYVWPAYAVFFVVLMADFLVPQLRRRRNLRELNARLARQNARQQRSTPPVRDHHPELP
jgi:heme exporter protein D